MKEPISPEFMRWLLVSGLLVLVSAAQAQTEKEITESKLNYCRYENEQLEKKVDQLTHMNRLQMDEILRLKHKYNAQEARINSLEVEIIRMKGAASDLLLLANSLEKQKQTQAAIQLCRTIVRVYPGTLEAESAAERIRAYEAGKRR